MLKEVAAWREREAQKRDVPRNRIIRDESVVDIAAHPPATPEDLARLRGLSKGFVEGRMGQDLLAAIRRGIELPHAEIPHVDSPPETPGGTGSTVELLKVLLKMKCEAAGVAQKLVATSSDLEQVASSDEADVPALRGWRRQLFGADALEFKRGKLALTLEGRRVRIIEMTPRGAES